MYLSDDLIWLLNKKVETYNHVSFIPNDPISVPHQFSTKEDIEISGFLTAIISWGKRSLIISQANRLMKIMDNAPHEFILSADKSDIKKLEKFYYRTLNADDLIFFVYALRMIYTEHGGLENVVYESYKKSGSVKDAIIHLRSVLLKTQHLKRSEKHIANPGKGSAAKRINMFFRWMIRKDNNGVDFGIWKLISPHSLMCPLDLHSGTIARKLGILQRNQNDWQAVEELTSALRFLDSDDPVKYDYALFGMGVFES